MDNFGKTPQKLLDTGISNFLRYDNFGLDYAESLCEGDLRPYIIKDYENKDEERE